MTQRKYNLTLAELIDRLHICQLKEIHGGSFSYEIEDILHDIQALIDEGINVDAHMIRAISILAMTNITIWDNEDNARKGSPENNNLWYTHQLNANRSECKARIQNLHNGRIDAKLNYLDGVWKISW